MGDQSDEVLSNRCRVSHKAKEKQYGYLVGSALGLDFDNFVDKKKINSLIASWLSKGVLKKKDVKGATRNISPCYWMEAPSISDDDDDLY